MSIKSLQPLFVQFPWLNGSSEYLFAQLTIQKEIDQISLEESISLLFSHFPELSVNILKVIEQLVTNQEDFNTPVNQLQHLAMYPLLQLLITILGNRVLGNALANIYAKHIQTELNRSDRKNIYTEKVLIAISENLGIICEPIKGILLDKTQYHFKIAISDYLKASTSIIGEEWRLINRPILNGYVLLRIPDLTLLIRETVRKKTKPDYSQLDKETKSKLMLIPEIASLIEQIESMIEAHTQRFQSDLIGEGEKIGSEMFPPCIRAILHHVNQCENFSLS